MEACKITFESYHSAKWLLKKSVISPDNGNEYPEGVINWNDPDLNINWNANSILVSEKDKLGEEFCNFATNFE